VKCDKNTPVGTKVKVVAGREKNIYGEQIWITIQKPTRSGKEWIVPVVWDEDNWVERFLYAKNLEVVDEKGN
jgi:hypothetical protein